MLSQLLPLQKKHFRNGAGLSLAIDETSSYGLLKNWSEERMTCGIFAAPKQAPQVDTSFYFERHRTDQVSTEPYFEFDFNDALESLKSCAGLISAVQGSVPSILDEERSAMVVKEPYGVVVSIAPWNAPCILGLRSFLGPLASKSIGYHHLM